jgi:hypothetical protein
LLVGFIYDDIRYFGNAFKDPGENSVDDPAHGGQTATVWRNTLTMS